MSAELTAAVEEVLQAYRRVPRTLRSTCGDGLANALDALAELVASGPAPGPAFPGSARTMTEDERRQALTYTEQVAREREERTAWRG